MYQSKGDNDRHVFRNFSWHSSTQRKPTIALGLLSLSLITNYLATLITNYLANHKHGNNHQLARREQENPVGNDGCVPPSFYRPSMHRA